MTDDFRAIGAGQARPLRRLLCPMAFPDPPHSAVGDDVFRAVFESSSRALLLMAADPPRFTMVAVNAAHAKAFSTSWPASSSDGVDSKTEARLAFPHGAR